MLLEHQGFYTCSASAGVHEQITINDTVTCTGTFTVTGHSPSLDRVWVASNGGTAKTISAAAVSLANVDFQDITAAGAATPWTGSSIGDCGGNTNITPTTPVTRYGVAAGGWSTTATWSDSSGGSPGSSVPLPQDDVYLNASSGSGTYSIDARRMCADMDCSGFTGTLAVGSSFPQYMVL
jgi:hypothetical protein